MTSPVAQKVYRYGGLSSLAAAALLLAGAGFGFGAVELTIAIALCLLGIWLLFASREAPSPTSERSLNPSYELTNNKLLALPLLPIAVTGVAWALTVGTRSGRRGAAVLALTLFSWAALSPAIAQSSIRGLLGLHPLALPWSAIRPFNSSRFDFTAPWWHLTPTAALWLLLLTITTWRGIRSAGSASHPLNTRGRS